VDLVVSESAAGVEDVVGVIIDETFFLRSVDQMGEADLALGIEAPPTETPADGLR
jgi:hypothetical protein